MPLTRSRVFPAALLPVPAAMLSVPAALLMALAALVGCTDTAGSSGARGCRGDTDCPLPERCVDARCVIECRADLDCAPTEECRDNVCVDPLAGCTSDADCRAFGLVCDIRTRSCVEPRDGGSPADAAPRDAALLVDGLPVIDAEPDPEPEPPRDRGVDPPRDATPPPLDRAVPPPDAALPDQGPIRGDARYGDPCRCGADCASGFCLQNPYTGGGQCTATCGGGRACEGIDRCVQARVPALAPGCPDPGTGFGEGDVIEICAPNETGVACRGGGDCVIDGLCITPPNPLVGQIPVQAVCGARCQDDRGCPAGFRCGPVGVQGGGQVQACGAAVQIAACPDGSNRSCGGVCAGGLAVSHCLVLDDGPGGYCSCACRTGADCPLGFACSPGVLDTGDPARPGICLPIAGYTCPAGDAQCLSTICLPGGAPGQPDQCTAPCAGPADCPGGYDCLPVPDSDLSICVAR